LKIDGLMAQPGVSNGPRNDSWNLSQEDPVPIV